MNRFNIGIDIDGTLTVPDFWIKPMNEYFKHEYQYGNSEEYDWLKIYNLEPEEFNYFYRNYGSDMHLNAKIRPNVANVINHWSKNYNIYYLTARQKWLTQATEIWLKKYGLPGDYYVLGSHNKLPKARELNCSIFIEDNYQVACQLAEGGIDVILLDCPYNRHTLPDKYVTRVHNWHQVAVEVEKITSHQILKKALD